MHFYFFEDKGFAVVDFVHVTQKKITLFDLGPVHEFKKRFYLDSQQNKPLIYIASRSIQTFTRRYFVASKRILVSENVENLYLVFIGRQRHLKQECIPVGCVLSAAVAVRGEGGSPPGTPRGQAPPGADPPGSGTTTVNRMTNRCKNITLPQTSFAGGNK